MGGRGQSSMSSMVYAGPILKGEPLETENRKSKSSGDRWKRTILEATSDGNGNVTLSYATPYAYEHPNNNTTIAKYRIDSGIDDGWMHNLDLSKARSVSGQTFSVKDLIKENGFRWDRDNKRWINKEME